ncbi:MAG: aminotransferase class V-fold PLP-dependent enzyme [Candidatus Micrarchaeota archaeon]|nr:aminotransferase class V-fold PLP-dependent enzyme [Candidatus Micrarchaeota archaeon]
MGFDVRKAVWPEKIPSLIGQRSKPWSRLARRWFSNATISHPYAPLIRGPFITAHAVRRIMQTAKENPEEANRELNRLYTERIGECTGLIHQTFNEPRAGVVFAENGTDALALLRLMVAGKTDEVITTSDEGRLVVRALKGEEFVGREENFRQPLGFFKPPDDLEPVDGKVHQIELFNGTTPKTNTQIRNEIIQAVKERLPPLVIIPHVSRTGRILPVEEIGRAIAEHNQTASRKTVFVVDGIQALGRLPHADTQKPLAYADAYVFTSAKALGASMQGAILARKDLLGQHVSGLVHSAYAPRLTFDQFHDEPDEVREFLEKRDQHYRVSLPEVHAMSEALRHYLERRKNEKEVFRQLNAERRQFLEGFRNNPHVKVLKPDRNRPLAPSIIAFQLRHPEITTADLKTALQIREDPITLPALIAETDFMRLGLSEVTPRTPKEISYVINEINALVSEKRPVAVMPGSFDPITSAHKANLEELVNDPRYQRVYLMPTQHYRSGKKRLVAGKQERRTMARKVVQTIGHPRLHLWDNDLNRLLRQRMPGHLAELARIHPGKEIVLAVGAAAFENFVRELTNHPDWKKLPVKVGFHVMFRERKGGSQKKVQDLFEAFQNDFPGKTGRLVLSTRPSKDVHSRYVREAIKANEPFEHWVPPEIAEFIKNFPSYGYRKKR